MTKRSTKWHEELKKEVLADPEARAEYETFKLQLDLADRLKQARKKAHLTQEKVAQRMDTQKPVVARLEAAGGKGKHSPSLKTLVKYADAVGCELQVKIVRARKGKKAVKPALKKRRGGRS
ncbi:helix-turn-helix domain-containing protein [Candidiatus Paracoxiella cheracis]|uniref:helix-turn-helix domain-containing protein n=1 Tax=Candidiatus Paracoxiella cheracis TaxID=3405120 RepID=UPI003BF5684F